MPACFQVSTLVSTQRTVNNYIISDPYYNHVLSDLATALQQEVQLMQISSPKLPDIDKFSIQNNFIKLKSLPEISKTVGVYSNRS